MSDALQRLTERNRHETKLEDGGLIVGWHYPDVQECLLAGDMPLPVLKDLPAKPEASDVAEALDAAGMRDVMLQNIAFRYRLVAAMLDDLDGVYLTPEDDREAIARALTPSQREELFSYASREKDPDSGEA